MGILDRFSLKGSIALVTAGSGRLFGSSLSEGLAEAGATVISASRSLERNEEFTETLREKGFDAHGMQVDICDVDSIRKLHADVIERFGRLDILVNSALARDGHIGPFEDQKPEHWRTVAAGDFTGLHQICQLFIDDMAKRGRGSIINIASIYGVVGNDPSLYVGTDMRTSPMYSFVKAGMINFTRYLASYYGKKGVRVNCISPGGYFDDQEGPFVERYTQRVPIGRMLDNEDVKGSVVFLASDASSYITGANLMVDGGWTSL